MQKTETNTITTLTRYLSGCVEALHDKYLLAVATLVVSINSLADGDLLEIQVDGVDETNDPVAFLYEVIKTIGRIVLVVIGFIVLVVAMKEVIKEVNEARQQDGKWGKAFGTAVGGIALIVFVGFLITWAWGLID